MFLLSKEIEMNELGKINIAYITSSREIGDDELIGREVIDADNKVNYGYREGNLENLARRIIADDNDFANTFNLKKIIVDDSDEQFERAWSKNNLWPTDLSVPITENGQSEYRTLGDMLERIPSSTWRKVKTRKNGQVVPELVQAKADQKAIYEQRIIDTLREENIDILISDSYISIFGPTILESYGPVNGNGIGQILNIHPAITNSESPYKLPGITPTRDAFTRAKYGMIIVDDKHAVDVPKGEIVKWEYPEGSGEIHDAVAVEPYNITGATVHIVDALVDHGPVILDRQYEFGGEGITPESIRERNYEMKRELLPEALLEYVAKPKVQQMLKERRIANNPLQQVS
jgi:folate-dependent phosphoribosylglycinamide formyltransferase PurN